MRRVSLQKSPDPADSTAMESTSPLVPAPDVAAEESLRSPVSPSPKNQSRKVILAMVLTLCLGLLLATLYLGGRISSTHASVARTTTSPAAAQPLKPQPIRPAAQSAAIVPAPAPAAVAKPLTDTKVLVSVAVTTPAKPASVLPELGKPAGVAAGKPQGKPAPLVVAVVKHAAIKMPPVAAEPQATGDLMHPKPGDAYVQVGAFVSPYAERWVEVLAQRGFHPMVADGPTSSVHRVLLGPLGPSEVIEVEAKLRQAGIEHFEKVY